MASQTGVAVNFSFASAAGALACTKIGAQAAMPTSDEVDILMQDQKQQ